MTFDVVIPELFPTIDSNPPKIKSECVTQKD